VARGLVHDGQPLPPCKVSWQSEHRLRFALKRIDPALVPWMCAQIGLQVRSLRRIRLGRVPMAGLPAGQWRWLQPHERF
jgi:23S rRNA pseudouridine2604 synthase